MRLFQLKRLGLPTVAGLTLIGGCHGHSDTTGPAALLTQCVPAAQSALVLPAGGDTVVSATNNSGCVAFPASPTDSLIYLMVFQSGATTPGDSTAYQVTSGPTSASASSPAPSGAPSRSIGP